MKPVRIERAEVLDLAIPLRHTFRHSLAERRASASVVVRLHAADGTVGHGEGAPRDYVTGESPASVRAVLARRLPHFVGQEFVSLPEAAACLGELAGDLPRDEHAAFCALELAVLDLVGKALGVSTGAVLGPIVRPQIVYSGVVSADGPDAVRKLCEGMRALQLGSVKVKVGRDADEDMVVLRTVREVFGDDVGLRVDANCAWTPDVAHERLAAFAPFRLQGAEQPVAADDLAGMAWLTARSTVPIIADESLVSLQDAERLATARACHVFNVRISKCGGLLRSRRIHDLGAAAGIATMLGAQVGETAVLSAAGRQFATRLPDVRHCEGSFGTLLLAADVAEPEVVFGRGGLAPALTGAGLGVNVVETKLRQLAADSATER